MSTILSVKDYSLDADTGVGGVLTVLSDRAAVENALRQWIGSFRGEILRNPRKGGYVIQWLMKPINDYSAQMIRESISEGLNEDFTPYINITKLEVTGYPEDGYWEINLEGYCPVIESSIGIVENIKTL